MAEREVKSRAQPPVNRTPQQAVRIRLPPAHHLAQIDGPFQRGTEVVVGLMSHVVEQGVFRSQASAADTLEHGRGRARPDLLLGDPDPEWKAEPPVKLEVAAVPRRCRDFEPPVFLVAEDLPE